jgi:transcriptional regulator with XRE-family HTH domain
MKEAIQQAIRIRRKEKGFTLRELAKNVGCTQSYLSQVEKGLTNPSLSMLGKIAGALDITVLELFNSLSRASEEDWHLAKKDRRTIQYPDGRVKSQILVSRISTRKMEPLITVIEPGGASDDAEKMRHPVGSEEFVLVLEGEVHFKISGKEFHIKEGDTLSFDGSLPHGWVNRGNKTSRVLFVFTPPIW